jgi:hypothetical protein
VATPTPQSLKIMKEPIGTILAIILIACAFYTFDYTSFNKICASYLLLSNGINFFIRDAESQSIKTLSKMISYSIYIVLALFLLKLLFYGV